MQIFKFILQQPLIESEPINIALKLKGESE